MPHLFFYLFSLLAVAGAIALVAFRNPVTSALSMVVSFLGFAALFVGLNAYFVGVIQVLVYAGAIMVLFLFIIMLLDLKVEEKTVVKTGPLAAGIIIPLLFVVQLMGVLEKTSKEEMAPLALKEASAHYYDPARARPDDPKRLDKDQTEIYRNLKDGKLPDVHLIGLTLFGSKGSDRFNGPRGYNFPLQMIGVLLLVATVGVVTLSLKRKASTPVSLPTQETES